jgi:tetratricopeptide (TPR) repeat protein
MPAAMRRCGVATFLILAAAGCSATDSDAQDVPEKPAVKADWQKPDLDDRYGAYLAAQSARAHGDITSSADNYLKVHQADPTDTNIMGLALLYTAADGRMDLARDLANQLSAVKPGNMLAGYVKMVAAAQAGDWGAAKAAIANLDDNGINSLFLPLANGWIALGQGDLPAVERALEPLSDNQAFLPVYNFHSALIYDRAGLDRKAEQAYEKTLAGGGGRSIHAVQAAGRFFNRIGKPERTAQLMLDYAQTSGDSPISEALRKRLLVDADAQPVVVDAVHGLGEALFSVSTSLSNAQIWELSLALTQLSLQASPDLDLALVLIGDLFEEQNNFERANQAYAGIGKDSPLSYSVRLRVAKNLERIEEPNQAVLALKALANEFPDRPEPAIELGNLYRALEDYGNAVKAYDEAFSRLKEESDRHWVLYYTRGVSLERSKQWSRAEKDFLKALELRPDQPVVLNYLGYSWLDRGEHMDRAQKMIEKAVEARPNDGYIVDSLGWAYYLRGMFAAAVEQLEQAVVLVSDDPTINDHLGDAYWRVGRRLEAHYQWQRALDLSTDDGQAEAIRKKIEDGLPPFHSQ